MPATAEAVKIPTAEPKVPNGGSERRDSLNKTLLALESEREKQESGLLERRVSGPAAAPAAMRKNRLSFPSLDDNDKLLQNALKKFLPSLDQPSKNQNNKSIESYCNYVKVKNTLLKRQVSPHLLLPRRFEAVNPGMAHLKIPFQGYKAKE